MSKVTATVALGFVLSLQTILTSCQQPKALSEDTLVLPRSFPPGTKFEYRIPVPPSSLQQPSGKTGKKELRYGFINKTGQFVIPPKFKSAGCFKGALAPVITDGGHAYIDKSGTFVTKPGEYVTFHSGNCSDTWPNYVEGLHPIFKRVQIPSAKGNISQPEIRSDYSYVNTTGKILISLAPGAYGEDFSDGMARFTVYAKTSPEEIEEAKRRNGEDARERSGYIDTTGKVAIPAQFNIAEDFRWGIAKVGIKYLELNPFKPNQKKAVIYYGFIDKQGRYLLEPKYTDVQLDCDAGKQLVKKSQELMGKNALTMNSPAIKKYFCDKGESSLQREGFVRVDKPMPPSTTMEDQLLSNDSGRILYQGKTDRKDGSHSYQRATPDLVVSEGLVLIKRDDDLLCYINNQGTIVIPCKFKEATPFSEGLAAVAVEVDPQKK